MGLFTNNKAPKNNFEIHYYIMMEMTHHLIIFKENWVLVNSFMTKRPNEITKIIDKAISDFKGNKLTIDEKGCTRIDDAFYTYFYEIFTLSKLEQSNNKQPELKFN